MVFPIVKKKKVIKEKYFKNAVFSILRGRNHGFGHVGANEGS